MFITVLDRDFKAKLIIDSAESILWTDRYIGHGDFEIYDRINPTLIELIDDDYYVTCSESNSTMIIENILMETDEEKGDHVKITGRSLESILDRRIILTNYRVINESVEKVIKDMINGSFISPQDSNRKVENFKYEDTNDPSITSTICADMTFERGQSVYDAVKSVCEAYDIGFKIELVDGNFIFKIYKGADRSYDQYDNPPVTFSPGFDNLISTNFLKTRESLKTVAIIDGDSNRVHISNPNNCTGFNRREIYSENTDASSDSELKRIAEDLLKKNSIVESIDGKVDFRGSYLYGVDFYIGDIVQLENEYGIKSKSRISEVVRSYNSSGNDVVPTFTSINK